MGVVLAQTLGRNVRARREALRLSREALAARVGCHPNWLGTVERGEKAVSLEFLGKVAASLGATPAALLQQAGRRRANAGAETARRTPRDGVRDQVEILLARGDPEAVAFLARVLSALLAWRVPSLSTRRRRSRGRSR